MGRIVAPTFVPPSIPGISFELPTRLEGLTEELIGATLVPGGTVPGGSAPATGGVHAESQVDRTVVARRGNPHPAYPAVMRSASLDGEVLVRFVVDTIGRVEPGSVLVLRATHEQFAESVRRWLPQTRYAAAQLRGRPVRQLVEQRVAFSLTH